MGEGLRPSLQPEWGVGTEPESRTSAPGVPGPRRIAAAPQGQKRGLLALWEPAHWQGRPRKGRGCARKTEIPGGRRRGREKGERPEPGSLRLSSAKYNSGSCLPASRAAAMELRGYGFLLLLLHIIRAVIALEKKIIVSKLGENTTLSCIYRGRELHLKNLRVYWQIADDQEECTVVHALISGQDNENEQCIHFKNRTRLFWDRLENGDFSLLLLNVSQSDEHTYKCVVLEKAEYTSMVHQAEVVLSLADTQQKQSDGSRMESHKNLRKNGQSAQAAGIVSIIILIGIIAVVI